MSDIKPWNSLIAAREARGWSRFHLASEMRINLSHLGNLEKGVSKPRMGTISRAAQALGVPIAQLVEHGEDAPSYSPEQQLVTRKEMETFVRAAIDKALRERK